MKNIKPAVIAIIFTNTLLLSSHSFSQEKPYDSKSLPDDSLILKAMQENRKCKSAISIKGLSKVSDDRWVIYFNEKNSYSSGGQLIRFHNGTWVVECGDPLNGNSMTVVYK